MIKIRKIILCCFLVSAMLLSMTLQAAFGADAAPKTSVKEMIF